MLDRQRSFVSDVARIDTKRIDLEPVTDGLDVLRQIGPLDVRDREVDRDFGAALFDAARFVETSVDSGCGVGDHARTQGDHDGVFRQVLEDGAAIEEAGVKCELVVERSFGDVVQLVRQSVGR